MNQYVSAKGKGLFIKRLPANSSPKEAGEYVKAVRIELSAVLGPSMATRRRIDLEGGNRGGYFSDPSTAINELITEAVDFARSAR